MKIYHQILILFMIHSNIFALTILNKSNQPIHYNIFYKDWFNVTNKRFKPLPIHHGVLQTKKSDKIDNLDEKSEYIITFYDVTNTKNNQRLVIKAHQKYVIYDNHNHKNGLISFKDITA